MRAAGLGGCCSLQRRCLDWVTATMTTAAILLIAQLPLGFAECWEAIVNPYFDCQWENHHCGMTVRKLLLVVVALFSWLLLTLRLFFGVFTGRLTGAVVLVWMLAANFHST